MTPDDFIRTLYLGDRACKRVEIDGWKKEVRVLVDCISRIRRPDGIWDYYTDEDLPDGQIVFEGVRSIVFDPPGPLPNDYIVGLAVQKNNVDYQFKLTVASVTDDGEASVVLISIAAAGIFLRQSTRPETAIRT